MKPETRLAELLRSSSPSFEAEKLILATTEMILELMESEEISRVDLARRIGKSKGHVSQLLNGKRNMTLRTLAEIAFALHARVSVETEQLNSYRTERRKRPLRQYPFKGRSDRVFPGSDKKGRSDKVFPGSDKRAAAIFCWLGSLDPAKTDGLYQPIHGKLSSSSFQTSPLFTPTLETVDQPLSEPAGTEPSSDSGESDTSMGKQAASGDRKGTALAA